MISARQAQENTRKAQDEIKKTNDTIEQLLTDITTALFIKTSNVIEQESLWGNDRCIVKLTPKQVYDAESVYFSERLFKETEEQGQLCCRYLFNHYFYRLATHLSSEFEKLGYEAIIANDYIVYSNKDTEQLTIGTHMLTRTPNTIRVIVSWHCS